MINLEYVKRKKRRKIVLIASLAASCVLAVAIVIAFLGQVVGSFTVSMKDEYAKISLSEHSDMSNNSTFLRVGKIPQMDVYTVSALSNHEQLDNEETDYHIGVEKDKRGNDKYLYFFKYTFFLKNTGDRAVSYELNLNVLENHKPKNGDHDLLDILRVRFYENTDEQHIYETFAKKSRNVHFDESENPSYDEAIGAQQGSDDFCGYAQQFVSDELILTKSDARFNPGDQVRFTIVTWLEGEDPQAVNSQPENCSLKLGVDITAYEVEED